MGNRVKKEKVICYGLGYQYKSIKPFLRKRYSLVYCADGNYKKNIGAFERSRFLSSGEVLNYDERIMICTTKYYEEIRAELMKRGVIPDRIIPLTEMLKEYIIYDWKSKGLYVPGDEEYEKKLFAIGDSHSIFFSGHEDVKSAPLFPEYDWIKSCTEITNCKVFHLGPTLAYSLKSKDSKTHAKEKTEFLINEGFIPRGSTVICCFGEIDIRIHIIKKAKEKGVKEESIINDVIDRYLGYLKRLRRKNNVIAWGAVASQADTQKPDPAFPHFGSERERNRVTRTFNTMLRRECLKMGIGYAGLDQYLIDENGKTRRELLTDGVHLSQKARFLAERELAKSGVVWERI